MIAQALLRLKGIRKSFDDGRIVALRGVDLTLHENESLALVGRSGSGKSSLLNIASGLDEQTEGHVYWQGREVSLRQDWTAIRGNSMGIVFQEFHLVPTLTAEQNVCLALMGRRLSQSEVRRRAMAMLDRVGVAQQARQLPSALSGGERQRVAIARALVKTPRVLFADEPTGNLDSENSAMIADLLLNLQQDFRMSLLLVTHDEDFAARCHRVVRLTDGKALAQQRGEVGNTA